MIRRFSVACRAPNLANTKQIAFPSSAVYIAKLVQQHAARMTFALGICSLLTRAAPRPPTMHSLLALERA